jgi:hypothetical protein
MFTDPLFGQKYGGPAGVLRMDSATRSAARAKFFACFPAAHWTNADSYGKLEVERNHIMFNTTVHASGREFSVEVSGPFDRSNWDYASVDMNLSDEAAFVGSGRTIRGAVENCVRSLTGTPYDDHRAALERETQLALESFPASDDEQGDGYLKLYCVIKAKS